ncbi:hypothetical protein DFH29DRAFT_1035980 [Suillus ampliporus]|nr:hypothetical protein DFH29DRAFT_1035980 [Suillus ampliporus]
MPYIKAHYHPFLFVLITMCAMAELGLTAYLISVGNESQNWPSARYHSLLILFEFNAVWTTLFGAAYMLWIVDASSIVWLAITSALWGAAAGTMHNTRTGGNCNWIPNSSGFVDGVLSCDQPQELSVSRCRETLTVEAVGWVLFGLCILTLLATCLWVRTSKRGYVSDSHRLV